MKRTMSEEIKNTTETAVEAPVVHDAELHAVISGAFPDVVMVASPQIATYAVKPAHLHAFALFLRDDARCGFDFPLLVTGVDRAPENRMEVFYHLLRTRDGRKVVIKIDLDRVNPVLPSLAMIYRSFDWHEREQMELLGITFEGHPDPRKLLLDDTYTGYPLRKEYEDEAHEYIKRPY